MNKKRWAAVLAAAGLLLLGAVGKTPVNVEDAQTITGLKLITGGLDSANDLTMVNPSAGTSSNLQGFSGKCDSGRTITLYWQECNPSGCTTLSPASAPITPTGASQTLQIAIPTIDPKATVWYAFYSSSSDGNVARVGCGVDGVMVQKTPAQTSATCACGTLYAQAPLTTTNTTHVAHPLTISADQMERPELRVLEVGGSAGSLYRKPSDAVAAITDASPFRHYTVRVLPGDYQDNVAMKSYVTLEGTDRTSTRLFGPSGGTITFAANCVDCVVRNVTIGGQPPINGASGATVILDNVVVGVIDGTQNLLGQAIDGIASTSNMTWYILNSRFNSTFDCFVMGTDDTAYFVNDLMFLQDSVSKTTALLRAWNTGVSSTGTQLFAQGVRIFGNVSATTQVSFDGLVSSTAGTGDRPSVISLHDVEMNVTAGATANGSSRGGHMCIELTNGNTVAGSLLDLENFRCNIASASASGEIAALKIANVTDFNSWVIRWVGGYSILSGGASRFDVDNADTGVTPSLFGVAHAGLYTGAGKVQADAALLDGRHRLTPLATAPATCGQGDYYMDTAGTMCGCFTANTWTDLRTNTTPGNCV